MELVVLGLSHRTAPLALRERLAFVAGEIENELKALCARDGVREAALVSTCNRVEAYVAGRDAAAALDGALDAFTSRVAGTPADSAPLFESHLYRHVGRAAVAHLFRVAASLDSLVVGEPQILGQLKDAYDLAARTGTVGTLLGACFPRAFRVARRVRRETGIAQNPVSVSSIAVDLARNVFEGFAGHGVLLVGAGKMADLAARALLAQGARVVVTNRTRARADELGARLGCGVAPWEALEASVAGADIVITSTGARAPIFTAAWLDKVQRHRRGRPLVLVDIAVPRDVEPSAASIPGVFLWDIDDLQKVAHDNLAGRQQEADRAQTLVDEEVVKFLEAQRGRGVGPTITALRARFLSVANAEAARVASGLPGLDERARRDIERLAESIAAKLLHSPQVVLKREAQSEEGEALVAAVQRLFELPVVEPVASPDDAERPGADPNPQGAVAPLTDDDDAIDGARARRQS